MILKRGYAERGDDVILTMTRADYLQLQAILGRATSYAILEKNAVLRARTIELTNRLNEGNPRWAPVEEGA